MIGLDTNLLLAWLLEGQARPLPDSPPYRVGHVVLAELVWVLRSRFGRSRPEIAETLRAVSDAPSLHLAERPAVERAIEDYRAGGAGFADYLIMRGGEAAGCATTATLDRKAARHPGFTLVP